jgi:hypothetical protein
MIQLVLVYCLIANANVCSESRPSFEDPLSLMGCMLNGQQTAATYVREHPQWRLSAFRCELDVPRQTPL